MSLPRTLLVGVDKSSESLRALAWALELAGAIDAQVVAVHAVGLLEAGGYRDHPDLASLVAGVRSALPDAPEVDACEEPGSPADVILRVAEREDIDLIVVGSRGLGGSARLLGSTSEAVVARAELPVVVIPSDG